MMMRFRYEAISKAREEDARWSSGKTKYVTPQHLPLLRFPGLPWEKDHQIITLCWGGLLLPCTRVVSGAYVMKN